MAAASGSVSSAHKTEECISRVAMTTAAIAMKVTLVARILGRGLRRLRLSGSLSDLFEVLLHELLVHQRHFVAMDFAASFGMRRLLLRPRSLELLLARSDLDHHFARHVLRALAEDLA